jgi:hypothetical protein
MDMDAQRDPFWKQALLVFLACVVFYVAGFAVVQWWRERRGPWEVTFQTDPQGAPELRITQPWLGIGDVTLRFSGTNHAALTEAVTVRFDEPTKGETLPFGRVKFLDTTFLPGTVTLDLFGHEIELLPRTLIVDKQQRPWRTGDRVELSPLNAGSAGRR